MTQVSNKTKHDDSASRILKNINSIDLYNFGIWLILQIKATLVICAV